MITCIFYEPSDKKIFTEIINTDKSITQLEADNVKVKKGFLQIPQNPYNQSLEFWQVLALSFTIRTLPSIVKLLHEVLLKYLETSKNKITIQNGKTKIDLEYRDIKRIDKIINEETVRKLLEPNESKAAKS